MSALSEAVQYLAEAVQEAELEGNTQDTFNSLLGAAIDVLGSWDNV